jgi:outer membrane lipoprotein carrier protein
MVSSVVGSCLTDDKTFKTTVTTSGAEWIATLVPVRKDIKQMFDKIILHFDKKRKVVTKIEMTERNGDKTTIVLQNIRTNENISANMFTVH